MAANGEASSLPRSESPAGSPRSASISLQAAATMNAGLQREPSQRSSNGSLTRNLSSSHGGRRRSTILMNLQLNDPSLPAPGEMAHDQSAHRRLSPHMLPGSPTTMDPHHHRAPSLGELHQELEAEQEAHVNRLLQMIRQQQLELQRLQTSRPLHGPEASGDDGGGPETSTPAQHPSSSQPAPIFGGPLLSSYSRSPDLNYPRSSLDMARADLHRRSRTPSRGASPRLRATSLSAESGDWALGCRDESAFYQAETQMLVRENQMLRHRIRDLEKQLAETTISSAPTTEPLVPSQLTQSAMTADEDETAPSAPKTS